MNIQAAGKTLLVVAGIGALMGFNEWRQVYGGTPEDRAKREIAQCVREREMTAYQANMFATGRVAAAQKSDIKTGCESLVRGGGLVLGTSSAKAAVAVSSPSERNAVKPTSPLSGQRNQPVKLSARHDLCLSEIEAARKRSPGGLNPEWEQSQRDRCETL